jgi:O-methyltransferase domain
VGGSIGFVCVALAEKFPNLKFVVQDLPKTVADAPSKIPADLHSRIEFQAHDFYTPQPVKDADVYFFRWICHNQSDKYGVKMLQALIPALKPGAKIVINDNCLPAPNTADPWDEKITRCVPALCPCR